MISIRRNSSGLFLKHILGPRRVSSHQSLYFISHARRSQFRVAVERVIDAEDDGIGSIDLSAEASKDLIPFAVTVNVRKLRAEFVLCSKGPDGCFDPIDFLKGPFKGLNINLGVTDFVLVYSDNANSFKSSPQYICEVSVDDVQMCWNPRTYEPVPCFTP